MLFTIQADLPIPLEALQLLLRLPLTLVQVPILVLLRDLIQSEVLPEAQVARLLLRMILLLLLPSLPLPLTVLHSVQLQVQPLLM